MYFIDSIKLVQETASGWIKFTVEIRFANVTFAWQFDVEFNLYNKTLASQGKELLV